jgi:hypothetical protein
MCKLEIATLSALASLLALGCQPGDEQDGTVLIVVMDGVRLEESLGDDPSRATGEHPSELMPRAWSALLPAGARSTDAWNLGATTTTPAHAAMLAGRRIPFANYPVFEEPGLYRPDLPTLFEHLRQREGLGQDEVLLMANTDLIEPLEHSTWPGLGAAQAARWSMITQPDAPDDPAEDDAMVLEALREALESHQPRLALVNLHKVDRAGHYGEAPDYPDRVRAIDEPLVDLWRWIGRQRAYRDDTWLMLVADHGRHLDADTDPPWRHHGCACNSCRRVPFLLLGPGVAEGQDLDVPMQLTDLAPTAAALLGLELPWASGLVQEGLLERPTGVPSRSGVADIAAAGGHTAELRYRDDPAHRSELWVDGELVSSPEAVEVEAPTMAAEGERAWLCFRELTLTPDEAETLWLPRCIGTADGGWSWTELEPPEASVGPYWTAQLLPTGEGSVLLAYGRNPYGLKFGGVDGVTSGTEVVVARLEDHGWVRSALEEGLTFPTDLSAVLDGDRLVLAVGAGRSGNEGRHTRDVYTASVSRQVGSDDWSSTFPADLGGSLAPGAARWRMERPALRLADGGLELAAVAYREGEVLAVLATSGDRGKSWGRHYAPALPGQPMPHVQPVWLGDRAYFPVVIGPDQDAQLCAVGLDAPVACTALDGDMVMRLAVDGERLLAVVHVGQGVWESQRPEVP